MYRDIERAAARENERTEHERAVGGVDSPRFKVQSAGQVGRVFVQIYQKHVAG